ncbi:hypothetical protein [Tsukamurella pseudospumae]|uniref:hypothetical protein n=1 Tax=Tsukamurella pseudospumae TaxID=239498 RepID=UPI000A595867|nr:hypothetical protein [Tsukamurella pseudospumae]
MTVIECAACWAEAKRQVRPHRGAILHHTYRLLLAAHDRAADRGEDTTGHE